MERQAAEDRFADVVYKALQKTFRRVKKMLREAEAEFKSVDELDVPEPSNTWDKDQDRLTWAMAMLQRLLPMRLAGRKQVNPQMFNEPEFWGLAHDDLVAASQNQIIDLLGEGVVQAERLGLAPSFDVVNEKVLELAGRYSDAWWQQLQSTTSNQLRAAIQMNIQTGAPLKDLVKALEPTFGRGRAKLIASTEVTRLYAEGNRLAYAEGGVDEVEWRTVHDARVDPICEGLDGQRWPLGREAQVPPAHPACRCFLAPVVDGKAKTTAAPLSLEDSRELSNALYSWQGNYDYVREIQQASMDVLAGRAPASEVERRASLMLDAINRGQRRDLYRAVGFGGETRSPLVDVASHYATGTEIRLPISSTSLQRSVAEQYLGKGERNVLFKLNQAQSHHIGKSSLDAANLNDEAITAGAFRVIGIRQLPSITVQSVNRQGVVENLIREVWEVELVQI